RTKFKKALENHSRFGQKVFDKPMDNEVLHSPLFKEIQIVKKLKYKAQQQIGTSGSGNHFVEFGEVTITSYDNHLQLQPGSYLALLTHSGSRGLGANIAQHYTELARSIRKLPKEAKHLAWLDMNSEAGIEYWLAMNLAGDYASACHHHIHERMGQFLGHDPIRIVENHHNFAWKETVNGQEMIVHRKGATPAGKHVLGIIPGSMTAPAFIVKGKGVEQAINSAAHGAGRKMSRSKAKNSITHAAWQKHLTAAGVDLIGGALDEAPFAYKDIHEVMYQQQDLVETLGTFQPKVVRMDRHR
ncbi:MAG: RtcB family protein, partial [Bacteroidota bacterium]